MQKEQKNSGWFPRIYALENCKSVTVGDKLAHQTLSHSFRRLPRGGIENVQFAEFSVLLQKIIDNKFAREERDSTRWIPFVIQVGVMLLNLFCAVILWPLAVETTSHLFFTCDMATSVHRLINRWWEVPDMEIDSYATWKGWIVTIRMASKTKLMFEGVYYVMWWLLWWYRNKKIFEGKSPIKAMFLDDVISKSFYWCRAKCKASFSWTDWLKNPHLISL
ncbi:hypothetical protein Tco_0684163 [Tanacetum coccineum]